MSVFLGVGFLSLIFEDVWVEKLFYMFCIIVFNVLGYLWFVKILLCNILYD